MTGNLLKVGELCLIFLPHFLAISYRQEMVFRDRQFPSEPQGRFANRPRHGMWAYNSVQARQDR
jgi:hypothetical protein